MREATHTKKNALLIMLFTCVCIALSALAVRTAATTTTSLLTNHYGVDISMVFRIRDRKQFLFGIHNFALNENANTSTRMIGNIFISSLNCKKKKKQINK